MHIVENFSTLFHVKHKQTFVIVSEEWQSTLDTNLFINPEIYKAFLLIFVSRETKPFPVIQPTKNIQQTPFFVTS